MGRGVKEEIGNAELKITSLCFVGLRGVTRRVGYVQHGRTCEGGCRGKEENVMGSVCEKRKRKRIVL